PRPPLSTLFPYTTLFRSWIFLLQAERGARQAHLGEPGPDGRLASDESGPSGGTALLPVPIGEQRAFAGQAVDVRRLVAHHAPVRSEEHTSELQSLAYLVC